MFIVLLSCFFHPRDNAERARAAAPARGRAPRAAHVRGLRFPYAQDRACRGPSEGRKKAPLAMLEVGERVESRAHSFGSREPQGGRNLVGGACKHTTKRAL